MKSLRCPNCKNVMLPLSRRHECTNRACNSIFEEHLAPGAMPRDDNGLVLSKADIEHMILALPHVDVPASARAGDVLANIHGRSLNSALEKLKIYQGVMEGVTPAAEISAPERERKEIVKRVRSEEITQAEGNRLMAEVAEQEEV